MPVLPGRHARTGGPATRPAAAVILDAAKAAQEGGDAVTTCGRGGAVTCDVDAVTTWTLVSVMNRRERSWKGM